MSLLRRISNLWLRSCVDREIDEELRSHIEMRTEDNIASGMLPEQARRDAVLRFGNPVATKESVVGADAALMLEGMWRDLRYALRQLWKNPGFSLTAIVVLVLGIAASVAIFAFVDAVLIKPLPYQNPKQIVGLFESTPLGQRFHLSYLDYLDWKRQNHVFSAMEAYDIQAISLRTPAGTEFAFGATVTAGFFRALGVTPALGRDFRAGEDVANGPRVVMLSYGTWQNRYGGRADLVGQTISLSGSPYEVVGVLPQGFHFAPVGTTEFWTPVQISLDPNGRGEHGLLGIARLKDGVTLQQAAGDVSAIAARLEKQYPDSNGGRGATVIPLTEQIIGNLRPILLLLLSGALLLLLTACVNVSGLLLVRSEGRRHEMAVRGALGASRARLMQQFVIEGCVLVGIAGLLGVGLASGVVRVLRLLIPTNMLAEMPYLDGLGLNLHVFLFAGAVVLLAAVLSSMLPLLRLSLTDLRDGLMEGGRGGAKAVWRHLGSNLVVVELCVAMVLLVGAGLLGKSFYRLLHVDIGMQPERLATMRVRAPYASYGKNEQQVALARRVTDEVSRLPGVESVAVAHQIPVSNVAGGNTSFLVIGRPENSSANNEANSRNVSAEYFKTIQARLVKGRYFTEDEDATKPRVAIVNEEFVRRFFPGEEVLGRQMRYDMSTPVMEIVGIVGDLREGPLDGEATPAIYTPFNQEPDTTFYVMARTAQAPQGLLKPMEATVKRIDPNILQLTAETMEDRIGSSQSSYLHRSSAWLVGGFALTALLLGMVGLYGVIAYSVSQRTKEIGVRMALGAQRSSVYGLILHEAGKLMTAGIGAGLVCSIGAATLMRKLLFGTAPWDVMTLAGVAAGLAVAAMLASYLPARRAASIDPVEALRAE
ncbi:ABC transporter permease [Edaphobacter flagellatus]|uniref:ABC transporter permease n=1 Tax=Edaphobacter flagellatus TaxID=1933044 RepID=UPI0021B1EB04|nr:ABC transporter permease [Edaphobacter flagellatus]